MLIFFETIDWIELSKLLFCWNVHWAILLCCRETLEQGLEFCRRQQRADGSWEG